MTDKEAFAKQFQEYLLERLTALHVGAQYSAKTLCGPDFWGSISPNECKRIGRLIAKLVDQEILPLHKLQNASNNSAQYELLAQQLR